MPDAINAAPDHARLEFLIIARAGAGRPSTLAHPCDYLEPQSGAALRSTT
jgi:hypothetical protein